ncbi:mismatch-specific DNA-glycosylase, partial [Streptomyces sp. SID10244]|nr:mismatch-specific DNA-glycosylase [Streptomyces sp. SID10244]
MGFTREELLACRGVTVPDLIGDDCRMLFVGINPGLWTAAVGAHFARPG